jgi:hypothetical protein
MRLRGRSGTGERHIYREPNRVGFRVKFRRAGRIAWQRYFLTMRAAIRGRDAWLAAESAKAAFPPPVR